MRYEGYHETSVLPVKRGQKVVIPAGVTVRSSGSRGTYVTKRVQTITVGPIMNGQSVPAHYALNDRRYRKPLEDKGYDFAPLEALRDANTKDFYQTMIPILPPTISWVGSGGYWCEVNLNDILDANGI